ncbi:semaphorin-4F-like [Antennarius striatus]|uniref:semaphorin-4F-like n=1 Tax=Antennarius striatus TaxID=241820 RepID=UPI0035B42FB9
MMRTHLVLGGDLVFTVYALVRYYFHGTLIYPQVTTPEVQIEHHLQSSSSVYSVLELIGKGCYGKVVRCTSLTTKDPVAVKIFKDSYHDNIAKEISMLKVVSVLNSDYNNIVTFVETFEYNGQTCLAFESLDKNLCDLFVALDALKELGVVHADLKPYNIMIVNMRDQPGRIKVIDFGEAIRVSDAKPGMEWQPIGYRAPEVFLGLPFTESVDVRGVGCILSFLYLADPIFSSVSECQMMQSILQIVGQPADHLLRRGKFTHNYFTEDDTADGTMWKPRGSGYQPVGWILDDLQLIECEVSLRFPCSTGLFFSKSSAGIASWAVTLGGMEDGKILGPEELRGVSYLSTFLMDHSSGMLYLGAKDAILAVDTNKLNQQPQMIVWDVPEEKRRSCMDKGKTQADCNNYIRLLEFVSDGRLYVCGTYAFDPQCAFLDLSSFTLEKTEGGGVKMETGRGTFPFEPRQPYTAIMADGILYTAATKNFLGTLFSISRATGPAQERIRTEDSINWLNEPKFVSSAFIQQSPENNPTGDDDKIYVFFTEVANEYDLHTEVKVSRVARVCKSDVGGMKALHQRWTTFLKAELVCEDRPRGQRYNNLTDVFTTEHKPGDPSSTHFYGLFSSQWEPEVSAVCVFSLSDISNVMDGPYKERKETCHSCLNPEPVPIPRPGQCLNAALKAAGFDSSQNLPFNVLVFARNHPLMAQRVTAAPLLVRKGITYTKLAVTLTDNGQEQKRALMHLGTTRGELHRVAIANHNATLLQEIPLFSSQEPVNNILLYQDWALVGSPMSLARVQAKGCSLYPSCEVCARARGLGCVWSTMEGACRATTAEPPPGDIIDEAMQMCDIGEGRCTPKTRELRVLVGLRLLLPCIQLSPRPCSWEYPPHTHTRQHGSDLEVTVMEDSLGIYICTCQEGGPSIRNPTFCRRAAYQLTLQGPNAAVPTEGTTRATEGIATATGGSRHILAIYILVFCGGLVLGVLLHYFSCHRRSIGHQEPHKPDNLRLSEMGSELLGSSTTHNATHSNPSNGHESSLDVNCNTSSSGLNVTSDILAVDMLDERMEDRMSSTGVEKISAQANETDDGLGDGIGEVMKGQGEDVKLPYV